MGPWCRIVGVFFFPEYVVGVEAYKGVWIDCFQGLLAALFTIITHSWEANLEARSGGLQWPFSPKDILVKLSL